VTFHKFVTSTKKTAIKVPLWFLGKAIYKMSAAKRCFRYTMVFENIKCI